jgi:hypothetical protein
MKQILASFLATSLMAAVAVSAAEGGASEVRAVDRSISAAVVLTPQGVERQARAVPGPSPAIPNKTEVGAPTWSSGQTWLLGIATIVACNAFFSHCAGLSPPTPLTPPGGESWRIKGCKSENTCPAWMYPPP